MHLACGFEVKSMQHGNSLRALQARNMDDRKAASFHGKPVAQMLYVCIAEFACCGTHHAGGNLFC